MFWLVFSSLTIIFAYYGQKSTTSNLYLTQISRLCLIITLAIVIAICGSVFIDHNNYKLSYYQINSLKDFLPNSLLDFLFTKTSAGEFGFVVLEKMIWYLGFNHIGLFFIIGLISNFLIVNTYFKFKYPVISIIIYLTSVWYAQQFNLVRQMLAVAILFYSLDYVEKKKWKEYIFLSILAISMHRTAIVCLLFTPFFFKSYDSSKIKYIKVVLTFIYLYSLLIALKIVTLDVSYFHFISAFMYESYMSNDDDIGTGIVSINYLYNLFVFLCFVLFKWKKSIYMICLIAGCVLNNLSVQMPNLSRMALYFSIVYPCLIPEIISQIDILKLKSYRLPNIPVTILAIYHGAVIIKTIILEHNIIGSKIESFYTILR